MLKEREKSLSNDIISICYEYDKKQYQIVLNGLKKLLKCRALFGKVITIKRANEIIDRELRRLIQMVDTRLGELGMESTTGEKIIYKPFVCEDGTVTKFPDNHCAFCEHCTDIFYDYTHGPYMFHCSEGHIYSRPCKYFKEEVVENNV